MSEVKLAVGGKEYAVACEDGQEAHLLKLGATINDKIAQLGEGVSTLETQKLLFGALFLADDLHESRAALQKELGSLEESRREATLALGQQDELKLTIERLEQELNGLRSAQEQHSTEVEDMRTELVQRREESEECRSELEKSAARVAELEQERTGLKSQLEDARSAAAEAAIAAPSGLVDDPDFAPALERFAEMLESCADKLEAGPASA